MGIEAEVDCELVALECNSIQIETSNRNLKKAMELASEQGGFTVFALVDALTRLSQTVNVAGDRAALDTKIGSLLSLAV
ncbi:MAG: hypothetical protein AB8B50_05820 [Pirellulaceae bacterium]